MFGDFLALRLEGSCQDGEGVVRARITAHEDVDGGITALRPSMDADMAFRQDSHARDATARLETMQVQAQDRRASGRRCIAQGPFDAFCILEMPRLPKIDEQMTARETRAVMFDKVVVVGRGRANGKGVVHDYPSLSTEGRTRSIPATNMGDQ